MVFAVALTGDIGAGKSTLASLWRSMGASAASADRIVGDLWNNHALLRNRAVERWGADLFDSEGGLLRKDLLCARAFGNYEEYRRLCEMIHPLVEESLESMYATSRGWFVAEIPLLFERGLPWWADFSVYVSSRREERLRRNKERGKTSEWLQTMEAWLLPRERRISLANFCLSNDLSREAFLEAGKSLGKRFRSMASAVEMTWYCGSAEEARKGQVLLESHRLGSSFRLGKDEEIQKGFCLSWLSLEKHFLFIKKMLQEIEAPREASGYSLRSFSPRRMDLKSLETLLEVCG